MSAGMRFVVVVLLACIGIFLSYVIISLIVVLCNDIITNYKEYKKDIIRICSDISDHRSKMRRVHCTIIEYVPNATTITSQNVDEINIQYVTSVQDATEI
tara:strand:- start:12835 stop:13134 length:300 start_codon:yes stop_codon:yes gene_type:complete